MNPQQVALQITTKKWAPSARCGIIIIMVCVMILLGFGIISFWPKFFTSHTNCWDNHCPRHWKETPCLWIRVHEAFTWESPFATRTCQSAVTTSIWRSVALPARPSPGTLTQTHFLSRFSAENASVWRWWPPVRKPEGASTALEYPQATVAPKSAHP